MKNLFILLLFVSCSAFGQQSLTSINGWNAYVHLPDDYNVNATIEYPTIVFFPGVGEVGTNAAAVINNGPGAYISQGWNGNITWNGITTKFIVISLQPPTAYPNEIAINDRLQRIKLLYRVDPARVYLTGLSHGGWCSNTFITGDPYGGPYAYATQVAAVVEVEGVIPDDNSPYPNLFDNFVLKGGKFLGFEQAMDNRGMPTRVARMNATVPGSAVMFTTTFGNGGHCCWSNFYGGQGTQPGIFNINGVQQNMYQWLAVIAEHHILALPSFPVVPIENKIFFTFFENSINVRSKKFGGYKIFNVLGQALMTGTYHPGSNTIDISSIAPGYYIFKSENTSYKFLKPH